MMADMWWIFLTIFLLVLGLGLLIAGIFTVYFGSGKSRGIGAGLLVGGIVVWIIVALCYHQDILVPEQLWLWAIIKDALVYLISGILGALAAIGLFLLAIMKS
jgi:hypothetical protein